VQSMGDLFIYFGKRSERGVRTVTVRTVWTLLRMVALFIWEGTVWGNPFCFRRVPFDRVVLFIGSMVLCERGMFIYGVLREGEGSLTLVVQYRFLM
jgi:hypothetical protein